MKLIARIFALLLFIAVAGTSCKPKQKCAAYSDIPAIDFSVADDITADTE